MVGRRITFIGFAVPAFLVAGHAVAQKVIETMPAKDGMLSGLAGDYFVRFDQPVDHIHSLIEIRQDGKVLETLHPRLKSEPSVLFARVPNLKPGKYVMHWTVPAANGSTMYQGDVPFSVSDGRP